MNYYSTVMSKYADFSGRARRSEYWYFTLFNFVFIMLAMIADNLFGTTIPNLPYGVFYCLYALFVILPGWAVSVRRLHDVGKSGWFLLIVLIPLIGAIWLFVLTVTEGDSGDNDYGTDPKLVSKISRSQNDSYNKDYQNDNLKNKELIFCSNCGKSYPKNGHINFCDSCGNKIESTEI